MLKPIEQLQVFQDNIKELALKQQERIKELEVVIQKCIDSMKGSNCLEEQWLIDALKGLKCVKEAIQ